MSSSLEEILQDFENSIGAHSTKETLFLMETLLNQVKMGDAAASSTLKKLQQSAKVFSDYFY